MGVSDPRSVKINTGNHNQAQIGTYTWTMYICLYGDNSGPMLTITGVETSDTFKMDVLCFMEDWAT